MTKTIPRPVLPYSDSEGAPVEITTMPKGTTPPGKPPVRTVPSDDCIVKVDGVEYAVHTGEHVCVLAGFSVGGLRALGKMRALGAEVAAVQGEAEEGGKVLDALNGAFADVTLELARRVKGWNWTDDSGAPLPPPNGTPEPFQALRTEEIYWLIGACQGESSAERKKG